MLVYLDIFIINRDTETHIDFRVALLAEGCAKRKKRVETVDHERRR